MDSQIPHNTHGHHYEQDPHHTGSHHHGPTEVEDLEHHEHKSVLKKVKAKAKKIKDTITKHGHGHHEHDQHIPDDHDLYEEDDYDEEMVEDPEVHEAPIYESNVVSSSIPGQVGNLGQSEVNLERSKATKGPLVPSYPISSTKPGHEGITGQPRFNAGSNHETRVNDPIRSTMPGHEGITGHPRVNLESTYETRVKDPIRSTMEGLDGLTGQPMANLGNTYETRANDPIRGTVFRPAEIIGQPRVNLGRTMVMGEVPRAPQNTPVSWTHASEQNRATDPTRTFAGLDEKSGQPRVNLQTPEALEEDPAAPRSRPEARTPPNSQTKVTEPTGAGTGEAGITPILHSFDKMNIYDKSDRKPKQEALPVSGVYKNQVPSAGSHDQFNPEPMSRNYNTQSQNPEKVSVTFSTSTNKPENYPHHEPTENPSNQSSYTEKITSATSSLSDKAITAKNVVASKLGYGEKGETDENRTTNEVNRSGEGTGTTVSGSAADYGKKIASTVTGKLSPVYEKVAGARSAVMSKMPGTGTGTTSSRGISGTETERRATRQDKGVSVKDYLAEKLRPGDEDRALSEVISESLHKRKTEEAEQTEKRPMQKVTESEEVAKQLGTGDDNSARRVQASYINSPGQGVVDKLKGAVGSWFGQTGETQPSQGQGAVTRDSREVDHGTEKRRLQESSN